MSSEGRLEGATAPASSKLVQPVRWLNPFRVVALIAAYNEADIVGTVVSDLIDQGVMVYFLDHCSTDRTVEVVQPYVGKGVIAIERFPADGAASDTSQGFEWEEILKRKEMLARELDAHWFIHHDADEFRESPWSDRRLAEAIKTVDRFGYNAIDFQVFNFLPTHNDFQPGRDPRTAFPCYAPGESFNKVQVRCWKKTMSAVDIATVGGHDAAFAGRRVFPIRFILRHYPIRGQQHGERKVFAERRARFVSAERARGWHVQYDGILEGDSFVRDAGALTPFDPDAVRLQLMLEHRGVEELEARARAAEGQAADLGARQVSEQRLIETLNREIERLAGELQARNREAERLLGIVETSQRERERSESEVHRLTEALAQADARDRSLVDALAAAEREARHADTQAQRVTGELSLLTSRRAVERADFETAARQIAAIELELRRAHAEIESLASTTTSLRNELDAAKNHAAALLSSASWRWMAPLRAAKRMVSGSER